MIHSCLTMQGYCTWYFDVFVSSVSLFQEKRRESLRVYSPEELWTPPTLAKFFSTGIAVGLKIPLILDALLPLILHMTTNGSKIPRLQDILWVVINQLRFFFCHSKLSLGFLIFLYPLPFDPEKCKACTYTYLIINNLQNSYCYKFFAPLLSLVYSECAK